MIALTSNFYQNKINPFPVLTKTQERGLIDQYYIHGNRSAGIQLLQSCLKFVVMIAKKYKRPNIELDDLIQEGNVGLMESFTKFKPEYDVRFVTYAVYYIKYRMGEFLLNNEEIVKKITTKGKRMVYFNIKKHKKVGTWLSMLERKSLADKLNVPVRTVDEVELGMFGPKQTQFVDDHQEDDENFKHSTVICDFSSDPVVILTKKEEIERKNKLLERIGAESKKLSERQQDIIKNRILAEQPIHLKVFAEKYGVSAEAIRQTEEKTLKQLKVALN